MRFLKKYGYWFLLLFAIGDFALPYFLGGLYPNYQPLKQVISILGDVAAPTHQLFMRGEVVTGTLAVLACPALYQTFVSLNKRLAQLITGGIAAFGIGDCIFTGIFSVNSQVKGMTLSSMIHGLGSGIGIIGLLVFPLLLAYAYRKTGQENWQKIYLMLFVLTLFTSGLNGLAQLTDFTYIGAIQRLSLFFLYLPVWLFAGGQLWGKQHPIR